MPNHRGSDTATEAPVIPREPSNESFATAATGDGMPALEPVTEGMAAGYPVGLPTWWPRADTEPDEEPAEGREEDTFPWWPTHPDTEPGATTETYHTRTQLPGRLSLLVDPGAWTNLIGADLARKLARRAKEAGHNVTQNRMSNPLNVAGVGSGHQTAKFEMATSITVPTTEGPTLHKFEAPIVEGTGATLPGILGLRSMEAQRGLLDMENRQLILPGPGKIEYTLPPGSMVIQLEKAPSGHLVMPIDDFERVQRHQGGIPPRAIQLLAEPSSSSSSK